MKRPAAKNYVMVNCPPPAQLPPLTECSVCKSKDLVVRGDEQPSDCTIVGSESFEPMKTLRKICYHKDCRTTHRGNFAYQDGAKVNTLTFNELEKSGIYLVTTNFGFTMKYLKLTLCRFLRGNLAPGQETSVRGIVAEDTDRSIHPQRFQAHLMHALEGYALAQRTPDEVVPFPLDRPSSYLKFSHAAFTFTTTVHQSLVL